MYLSAAYEELQAQCAVMRQALEDAYENEFGGFIRNVGKCRKCGATTSSGSITLCRECLAKEIQQALSYDIGKTILDRMEKMETALRWIEALNVGEPTMWTEWYYQMIINVKDALRED
jgi:hypothetical protein